MIVIFSGSSGVGKNTIINDLLEVSPDFLLMPTMTTRPRRENERIGRPYYFVSRQEFEGMIARDEFYEHRVVHDVNYYGTSKKILDSIAGTDNTYLKDIDVEGTMELSTVLRGKISMLRVFLYVADKKILVERLRERGETDIALRLKRYDMELSYAPRYDYIINNSDRARTLEWCRAVIDCSRKDACPLLGRENFELCPDKVRKFAGLMMAGVVFDPLRVVVRNSEVYIVDGCHRYLASLLAGTTVAKEIIDSPPFRADQESWLCEIEKARTRPKDYFKA